MYTQKSRPSAILFILKINTDEGDYEMPYSSIEDGMDDIGLKVLFDNNKVTSCSIWSNNQRITARNITKWDVLYNQLVSNASTILRKKTQHD